MHLTGVYFIGVHFTGVHHRMLPFLLSHTYVGPGLMQHFSGPPQLHLRCRTKVLAFMTLGRAREVLEERHLTAREPSISRGKTGPKPRQAVARSKKREARSKDNLQDEARWTGHS